MVSVMAISSYFDFSLSGNAWIAYVVGLPLERYLSLLMEYEITFLFWVLHSMKGVKELSIMDNGSSLILSKWCYMSAY